MKRIGRENSRKKQPIFTKETLGVVLMLFATLALVCLITREVVFSTPGKLVNQFLLGCFGYFAYPLCAFIIFLGVLLFTDKKTGLSGKKKLLIFGLLFFIAILVHTITMREYVNRPFGEYLSLSYSLAEGGIATSSGGGVITGLIAYCFSAVLSSVGTYVVVSIIIIALGYFLVKDFNGKNKGAGKNAKSEFNSSYVKSEEETVELPDFAAAGEKEYPVPSAVSESAPTQKLFVTNAQDFGIKSKKELKKDEGVGIKIDYAKSGFGMGNSGASYSDSYEKELSEKIKYIKTPQKIDLTERVNLYSEPQTVVSDTVKPAENVGDIPLILHDEERNETALDDSAKSHADSFLSSYADIPEVTDNESEKEIAAEPEIFAGEEKPAAESIAEEIQNVRTSRGRDGRKDLFDFDAEDIETFEENEEPIKEEIKPEPSPIVRDRRARNILFGDKPEKTEEPEEKNYTSRVRPDGNARSAAIFDSPKMVETEKEPPKKETPPINREYFRPPLDLLENYDVPMGSNVENHAERMRIIAETLSEFGIDATPVSYVQGPSVTRYEVKMPSGVSVKKILNFDDDLMAHLAVKNGVRIEAPIPGKNLVGIEVANSSPVPVGLKQVLLGMQGKNIKPDSLTFAIGKNIVGESMFDDLSAAPHYLVAGATGSGKSICLHIMIVSLLMRYSPEELRFIFIDPKRVEFRKYEHLPHLMVDEIINEPKKVLAALSWAIEEMERRYKMFEEAGAFIEGISSYNSMIANDKIPKMPRIVIIIDELADLMCSIKKDLETKIQIIAQKARAAGIHLVLATQRPSANVITGVIKTNLPSRIALKVSNYQDSIIILDGMGAEKLLGRGDMLYRNSSMPDPERYQGAFIKPTEIKNIVEYIIEKNKAYFNDEMAEYLERTTAPRQDDTVMKVDDDAGADGGANGDLLRRALAFAINSGTIAISQIQRRFQVGYARAGGIIDKMEQLGYVSGNEGSKARKVLITREEFEQKYGPMPE